MALEKMVQGWPLEYEPSSRASNLALVPHSILHSPSRLKQDPKMWIRVHPWERCLARPGKLGQDSGLRYNHIILYSLTTISLAPCNPSLSTCVLNISPFILSLFPHSHLVGLSHHNSLTQATEASRLVSPLPPLPFSCSLVHKAARGSVNGSRLFLA